MLHAQHIKNILHLVYENTRRQMNGTRASARKHIQTHAPWYI